MLHLGNVAGFTVPATWYPCLGFGDVGVAAAGPVSIAMLVPTPSHAARRHTAQALVCLLDDTGGRWCVIPVHGGVE